MVVAGAGRSGVERGEHRVAGNLRERRRPPRQRHRAAGDGLGAAGLHGRPRHPRSPPTRASTVATVVATPGGSSMSVTSRARRIIATVLVVVGAVLLVVASVEWWAARTALNGDRFAGLGNQMLASQ